MAHVQNSISSIKTLLAAQQTVAKGINPSTLTEEQLKAYAIVRTEFNIHVAAALIGSKLGDKNKKGEWVISGMKSLPNKTELVEVLSYVTTWVNEVESAYPMAAAAGEMGYVDPNEGLCHVANIEKINGKAFHDMLIPALNKRLNTGDFMLIAAMAERLRKRKIFWIGAGIALVLVVGVGGVLVYKHVKDNDNASSSDPEINVGDSVDDDIIVNMEDDEDDLIVVTIDDDPTAA